MEQEHGIDESLLEHLVFWVVGVLGERHFLAREVDHVNECLVKFVVDGLIVLSAHHRVKVIMQSAGDAQNVPHQHGPFLVEVLNLN